MKVSLHRPSAPDARRSLSFSSLRLRLALNTAVRRGCRSLRAFIFLGPLLTGAGSVLVSSPSEGGSDGLISGQTLSSSNHWWWGRSLMVGSWREGCGQGFCHILQGPGTPSRLPAPHLYFALHLAQNACLRKLVILIIWVLASTSPSISWTLGTASDFSASVPSSGWFEDSQ